MEMNKKTRNPLVGAFMAIAFLGFGAYRMYSYFVLENEVAVWRLILSAFFILYGLFLVYQLITANKDKNYE